MTQEIEAQLDQDLPPLNPRQKVFARELGVVRATGGRDDEITKAYESAGYAPDRGNARRLAADPRVKAIAEQACADALERAGLHIQYLQAKALELLHASPTRVFRNISKFIKVETFGSGENEIVRFRLRDDLSAEEECELDSAAWPLSEFKIDKDGILGIKLPDKKAIIEMLAKQLGAGGADTNVSVGVTLETLVAASYKEKAA